MAKNKILIKFDDEKLDRVFYQVRVGIKKVIDQCGDDASRIRIAVPKYFVDMLGGNYLRHINQTPLSIDDKITFFGYTVNYNFDNFIVVYHEDMPMFLENYYAIIDLK